MIMKKSRSRRMSMKGGRDWKICRRLLGRQRGHDGRGAAWGRAGPGAPDSQNTKPHCARLLCPHSVLSWKTSTQRVRGRIEAGVAETATSSCLQSPSGTVPFEREGQQKAKCTASGAKVSFHEKWVHEDS